VSANFIVFDLSTFIFSTDTKWTRASLEAAFKQQNMAVVATQPRAAVTELITGWYAGPNPNKANDAWVPAAWHNQDPTLAPLTTDKLYLNVVRTCRTCHTALIRQNLRTGVSWNTYAQFQNQIRRSGFSEVCGVQADRDMSHDAISYLNFWRFKPPDLTAYPMGGIGATTPMMQPFLDMGAFLAAKGTSAGACINSKGRPTQ
jgi:hypothetical protein